jgi:hypothetical protein
MYFLKLVSNYTGGGYQVALTSSHGVQSAGSIQLASGQQDAVLQGTGDLSATGNALDNRLQGNAGANALRGAGGNDVLIGGAGNDALDGGAGIDTAVFSGPRSAYTITQGGSGMTVASSFDGTDSLQGIERLRFSDTTVAFDVAGNAGQVYRLYQAAFDRVPDGAGLKYWIAQMDSGQRPEAIAAGFIASEESLHKYGSAPTNAQFLGKLYDNILHRAPDAAGFAYWLDLLDKGQISHEVALVNFAESHENQIAVIGTIQNGIDVPN